MPIFLGLVIAGLIGAFVNVAVIRRFRQRSATHRRRGHHRHRPDPLGYRPDHPACSGGASGKFETPFDFRFRIDPAVFNGNHLVAMVAIPLIMLAVIGFLRFTDYGVVIRAAAENGDRASLLGIPVPRLSTIVWAIAGLLSATAVILRVPILGFTSFVSRLGRR